MTVTRSAFITEALTWEGTPYRHQGRLKGVGVDCIGLLVGVAHALGLTDYDLTDYDKRPDGSLRARMNEQLDPIPLNEAKAGDVLLFAFAAVPMHVGILVDDSTIIHAHSPNRKVVLNRVDERLSSMIDAAFHVPGVG